MKMCEPDRRCKCIRCCERVVNIVSDINNLQFRKAGMAVAINAQEASKTREIVPGKSSFSTTLAMKMYKFGCFRECDYCIRCFKIGGIAVANINNLRFCKAVPVAATFGAQDTIKTRDRFPVKSSFWSTLAMKLYKFDCCC